MSSPDRVTIRDVAARAGVSVATVSKVLNHRYGVSARTAARVQAVIDELGFQSSIVASSLRSHRSNVLGILVDDFEPFSTELLKGAARAVQGSGYELLAYSAGGLAGSRAGWERRYLSRLGGTLIDGALLVTPTVVDPDGRLPVVVVDPHTGPTSVPTVASDNVRGGELATTHLLQLGHRRIAFIAGRSDLESARLRRLGYRSALRSGGLTHEPDLDVEGGFRPDRAAALAYQLLSADRPPTAVFASNDVAALAVIEAAAQLGVDVPGELSVVGFDDIPEAAAGRPPLTTVAQPIQQMGQIALRMLIDLLAGQPTPSPVVLPATLIVRASTGPPPPEVIWSSTTTS